jgi:hypothetical protein
VNLLGSNSFDEQLQPLLEQRRAEIEIPRSERLTNKPSLDELFADAHDISTRTDIFIKQCASTNTHSRTLGISRLALLDNQCDCEERGPSTEKPRIKT